MFKEISGKLVDKHYRWLWWGMALGLLFLYYGASLNNYFFQDDFYFLRLARVDNIIDFLNFFNPWQQHGFPAFRPFGTQVPFFIAQTFFPRQAYLFLHFLIFLFHFLNFVLIEKIIYRLTKRFPFAFFLALLYLLAPLHFLSFYYIAAFQQVIAAFFQILGFYFYLVHINDNKKYLVYIFFVLALLSKETAVIFPLLLFLFSLFIKGDFSWRRIWGDFKKEITFWFGFFTKLVFYFLVRFLSFVHAPGNEYSLGLNIRTLLSSWRWYLVWLLGAPETIIRYAGRYWQFSWTDFVKDTGIWGYLFSAAFLAELGVVCLILARLRKKSSFWRSFFLWLVWFGAWFIFSLLAVSFFPYHRYAHYVDLAFFGFLLLIVKMADTGKKWALQRLLGLFGFFFLFNSFFSIQADRLIHWAPARARIAAYYQRLFKENGNFCRQGVYFTGEFSQEVAVALSLNDGPRYFCQNYQLPVFYEKIKEPPKEERDFLVKIPSRVEIGE